jgi:hypothetical protein
MAAQGNRKAAGTTPGHAEEEEHKDQQHRAQLNIRQTLVRMGMSLGKSQHHE